MPIDSGENICYDNPVFKSVNEYNSDPTVSIKKAPQRQELTANLKHNNSKVSYKSKFHSRLCLDIIQKYEPIITVVYFVTCIITIILICNLIAVTKPNQAKQLKCNVCGDGKVIYYYHSWLGDYWGDRCDKESKMQRSYVCKEDSACVTVETTIGSGRKLMIEYWKKYLQRKNTTMEIYLKKWKKWLHPLLPGITKGCIHGSGHSWVRNGCHYFNSSVWDYDRLSNKYNSTWRHIKTCLCTQDNCN